MLPSDTQHWTIVIDLLNRKKRSTVKVASYCKSKYRPPKYHLGKEMGLIVTKKMLSDGC